MRTPPARTTRGAVRPGRLACITLFVALCAFVPLGATQQSPAIRVAGRPAVRGAIAEISRTFEAQTGVRVDAEYDVFAVIKRRIDRGETFDIVVLSPELIHNLVTARTVVPETVSLGSQGVGLAARAGQAISDIQTVGALTKTLLAAQSIGYFREGTAGAHFLEVVERLGISPQLRGVLRGYDAAELELAVRTGAVQYVTAGIATLRALPGLGEVATLPADLQTYTAYTAGALATAKDPAATRAFLRYLTSPLARKVLVSHGLEPVAPLTLARGNSGAIARRSRRESRSASVGDTPVLVFTVFLNGRPDAISC
jgi:molybdate transport system substrate-binding protein